MSETVRKRRRWPYVFIGLILLAIAVPFAWAYRPLNAAERELVGTWAKVDSPGERLNLGADRTYTWTGISTLTFPDAPPKTIHSLGGRGTWTASSARLILRDDTAEDELEAASLWESVLLLVLRPVLADEGSPLRAEGDRVWIGDDAYSRVTP